MIQSGRTQQAADEMIKWYNEEYQNVAGDVDWLWGVNETTLENLLDSRTRIPFRDFMVRYLLYVHADSLMGKYPVTGNSGDEKKWISEKAGLILQAVEKESLTDSSSDDSGEKGADGNNAIQILDDLTQLVFEDFIDNGFYDDYRVEPEIAAVLGGTSNTAEQWDLKTLRQKITADTIKPEEFYAFAFGLNMSFESVDIFLKKCFFLPGFDLWKPADFILYITFSKIRHDRYKCWQWMTREFAQIKNEYTPANTLADDMKSEGFSTITVKSWIDSLTESINFDSFDPSGHGADQDQLRKLLIDYYDITGDPGNYTRTYKKVMKDLLDQINRNLEKEIADAREDQKQVKAAGKEKTRSETDFAEGYVTVYYNPEKGIEIPRGIEFYKMESNGSPTTFVSTEEVFVEPSTEPPCKEGDVYLVSENLFVKGDRNSDGLIPKQSVFICEEPSLSAKIKEMSNISLFNIIGEDVTGEGDRKAKDIKEGEEAHTGGKAFLICQAGTEIPQGTRFYTEKVKKRNDTPVKVWFRTKDKADFCASAEVHVRCKVPDKTARADTITDCEIDDWKEEGRIIRIGNKTISKPKKKTSNKTGDNPKTGVLCKFLYPLESAEWEYTGILQEQYFEKVKDVLEGTDFTASDISNIGSSNGTLNPKRCDLVTFSFLAYASELERKRERLQLRQAEDYGKPYDGMNFGPETLSRYSGFVLRTNELLAKCGFYELYQPNPYDSLIMFLLSSRDAVNAFRNLWGWYLARKNRQNGAEK